MGSTNLFLAEMEKKLQKVKEEMDRLKKENQELKEKLKKE
jgi:predicted nuclease with TOPRIM domain